MSSYFADTTLAACRPLSALFANSAPFILLPAAVAGAAHYLGLGPAILTLVLALIGVRFGSALVFLHPPGGGATFLFVPVSAALMAMEEVSRRRSIRLASGRTELQGRVRQRTQELDAANQSLRELSGRLLHLQDEERRRIARELRDSVGQLLVSLSLNLSRLRTDLERLCERARCSATVKLWSSK